MQKVVRIALCGWLCKRLGFLYFLAVCIMYAGTDSKNNIKFFYFGCLTSSVFSAFGAGTVPLTCRSTSCFGVLIYAMICCGVLSHTPADLAYSAQCGCARTMIRALTGVMITDVRKVIGCNAVVSMAYLASHWREREAMATQGYAFNTVYTNEVVSFSALVLIFLSINFLLTRCAEVQREELSHARIWQESSSKLLAVLCDAVCSVTSDLQVIGPCQMLSDLQDVSQRSTSYLSLSSLLRKPDLPRLANFLRSQEAGLPRLHPDLPILKPAASLHVTFCCQKTGKEVPVQLLAVAVPAHPSREGITHLIGLKHEGGDASVREEDSRSHSIADGSLEVPCTLGPSSQSASSGRSSRASLDSLATAGLGIESVTFDVDAASEDLAIQSVTVNFDATVLQGITDPRPAMSHYVTGDVGWDSLKIWLRDATNCLFDGQEPAPGPDLHLRLPSGASSSSTSLQAMVLEMEEVLVDEFDDSADADETLPVRIRLTGFQVLTRRTPRFSSHRFAEQFRPQQLPKIREGNREEAEL
eukprot:TRINITY_DN3742_c0_g1_i7.p1 TRINITY_DN3742_c0_g1~~TRINITY_DN3742_c0_g1_i7.p1  ORF type:complete len:609 (-),score=48.71 TRINITY_DN3742_c0_g1_i7:335-1918(-)